MKSYTIHLIRHGLTEGNLEGRYVGRTDMPLCKAGAEELKKRREEFEYPAAQAYFTSPLLRCKETLALLYPEAKPIVIDDLRESDFGDWEGKTAEELQKEDPRFLEWMESGREVTPPNGESGAAFMQRTCMAFEKIVDAMLRSGTLSAVIVAHGGTIMSILSAYGLPKAQFFEWMTQNGCGYSLRITPGLWMRSMVAEVYDTIPPRQESVQEDTGKWMIDVAREAAARAFGEEPEAAEKDRE